MSGGLSEISARKRRITDECGERHPNFLRRTSRYRSVGVSPEVHGSHASIRFFLTTHWQRRGHSSSSSSSRPATRSSTSRLSSIASITRPS
jgi:hypothetical protein